VPKEFSAKLEKTKEEQRAATIREKEEESDIAAVAGSAVAAVELTVPEQAMDLERATVGEAISAVEAIRLDEPDATVQ